MGSPSFHLSEGNENFMSARSETLRQEKPMNYQAILWAGLIAGTMDITAACTVSWFRSGRSPVAVCQGIASGLLGADALQGGLATAALGLAIHYFIAFTATVIFFLASRKIKFLIEQPIISGLLYGIVVYLFMNGVVLPLTFHRNFFSPVNLAVMNAVILMFCIGLPIALITRKFSAASVALALIGFSMVFSGGQSVHAANPLAASPLQEAAQATVLVELFTSEGCSTCPPADELLAALERVQPVEGVKIVALSEHVDYWNRLGWKDPFSSVDFSQRQIDYMKALGTKDYYTPQMIVDGRVEFIGSKHTVALEEIAKAARLPKAVVKIAAKAATVKSVTLSVEVDKVPELSHDDNADVILAITEGGLLSKVTRGENSGHDLPHSAVTRKLTKIGSITKGAFAGEFKVNLEEKWKRENLKAVVFVQERASRRVLGASVIDLRS
jgi:hypothetical protein